MSRKLYSVFLLTALTTACGGDKDGQGALPPPIVPVEHPSEATLQSTFEYIGHTSASEKIEVKARIQAFLEERLFTEGQQVESGDTLFLLEDDTYKAHAATATGRVSEARARLKDAQIQMHRFEELAEKGYVSNVDLDNQRVALEAARTGLNTSLSELENANTNLGYTRITAPIGGRITQAFISEGNFVGPESGPLAEILKLDPIYVYINISDKELARYKAPDADGKPRQWIARIRFADGSLYEHEGKFDYINPNVDTNTGTIKVRANFPNPDKSLLSGQFVTLQVVSATSRKVLQLPQKAILYNQDGAYVYVVGEENIPEARPVVLGEQSDANVVITNGLTLKDLVITDGIQKIQPGSPVKPASMHVRKPDESTD
jgi:membrane fusion protein (multidrug efflux system)